VLVAPTENRAVKALTFSSQKWAHLAGGPAIVRASVARHGEERVLQRPDDELADLVIADVAALTGVVTRPAEMRVTRWGGALPQYAVGHLDRVRRIRAEVDRVPGLAVCGAAYDGVGVPACIRTGRQAASRVLAHLAVERQSEHG
jgi:oxygen-dependent protoporphyrinogen oxidase